MKTRLSLHPRLRRRHGIMLFDLLMALILLALFGLIAGHLFHATMRSMNTVQRTEDAVNRMEQAIHQMRADAWGASEFSSVDRGVRIVIPGGDEVTWRVDPAGILTRDSASAADRAWSTGIPGTTLSLDGEAIALKLPDRANATGGTVLITSALRTLGKATP